MNERVSAKDKDENTGILIVGYARQITIEHETWGRQPQVFVIVY